MIAQSIVTLYNNSRRERRLPDRPVRVKTAERHVVRRRSAETVSVEVRTLSADHATPPVADVSS